MKTKDVSIEALISRVQAKRAENGRVPLPPSGWQAVAGRVRDDALFREAARLGEAWRNDENLRR